MFTSTNNQINFLMQKNKEIMAEVADLLKKKRSNDDEIVRISYLRKKTYHGK